jgi:hypothetical protein
VNLDSLRICCANKHCDREHFLVDINSGNMGFQWMHDYGSFRLRTAKQASPAESNGWHFSQTLLIEASCFIPRLF